MLRSFDSLDIKQIGPSSSTSSSILDAIRRLDEFRSRKADPTDPTTLNNYFDQFCEMTKDKLLYHHLEKIIEVLIKWQNEPGLKKKVYDKKIIIGLIKKSLNVSSIGKPKTKTLANIIFNLGNNHTLFNFEPQDIDVLFPLFEKLIEKKDFEPECVVSVLSGLAELLQENPEYLDKYPEISSAIKQMISRIKVDKLTPASISEILYNLVLLNLTKKDSTHIESPKEESPKNEIWKTTEKLINQFSQQLDQADISAISKVAQYYAYSGYTIPNKITKRLIQRHKENIKKNSSSRLQKDLLDEYKKYSCKKECLIDAWFVDLCFEAHNKKFIIEIDGPHHYIGDKLRRVDKKRDELLGDEYVIIRIPASTTFINAKKIIDNKLRNIEKSQIAYQKLHLNKGLSPSALSEKEVKGDIEDQKESLEPVIPQSLSSALSPSAEQTKKSNLKEEALPAKTKESEKDSVSLKPPANTNKSEKDSVTLKPPETTKKSEKDSVTLKPPEKTKENKKDSLSLKSLKNEKNKSKKPVVESCINKVKVSESVDSVMDELKNTSSLKLVVPKRLHNTKAIISVSEIDEKEKQEETELMSEILSHIGSRAPRSLVMRALRSKTPKAFAVLCTENLVDPSSYYHMMMICNQWKPKDRLILAKTYNMKSYYSELEKAYNSCNGNMQKIDDGIFKSNIHDPKFQFYLLAINNIPIFKRMMNHYKVHEKSDTPKLIPEMVERSDTDSSELKDEAAKFIADMINMSIADDFDNVIQYLIDNKLLSIYSVTNDRFSALQRAIKFESTKAFDLLLKSSEVLPFSNEMEKTLNAALWSAVLYGNVRMAKALIEHNASLNSPPFENISQYYVASFNNIAIPIQKIKDLNIDTNISIENIILHISLQFNNFDNRETTAKAIKQGAKINEPITKDDTALTFAVSRKNLHLVQILCEAKADPTYKNNNAPLILANQLKQKEIFDVLIDSAKTLKEEKLKSNPKFLDFPIWMAHGISVYKLNKIQTENIFTILLPTAFTKPLYFIFQYTKETTYSHPAICLAAEYLSNTNFDYISNHTKIVRFEYRLSAEICDKYYRQAALNYAENLEASFKMRAYIGYSLRKIDWSKYYIAYIDIAMFESIDDTLDNVCLDELLVAHCVLVQNYLENLQVNPLHRQKLDNLTSKFTTNKIKEMVAIKLKATQNVFLPIVDELKNIKDSEAFNTKVTKNNISLATYALLLFMSKQLESHPSFKDNINKIDDPYVNAFKKLHTSFRRFYKNQESINSSMVVETTITHSDKDPTHGLGIFAQSLPTQNKTPEIDKISPAPQPQNKTQEIDKSLLDTSLGF